MTRRDELLARAERCEKASEGGRELDAEIMAALFRRESRYIGTMEERNDGSWRNIPNDVWVDPKTDKWVGTHAREFTTSLDAAMRLVPDGFMRAIGSHNENNQPWACLTEPGGQYRDYAATGADEVLALCAAALRAQAEMEG